MTIDTEFSIGGNFADEQMLPVAEPIVLGSVGGREHGLGFLLDSRLQSSRSLNRRGPQNQQTAARSPSTNSP
jgi:hypothetical protein